MSYATIKKCIIFVYTLVVYVFPTSLVFAQPSSGSVSLIPNPLGENNKTLASFIALLLDTIFPIAGMVSVFFLIYAGFMMVMAGGNEEKLKSSKQAFLWTVIGISILLGAKVLSIVICGTLNQITTLSCTTP